MKKILPIIILLCTAVTAQNLTERSYNCIFNMAAYEPMEARAEQKGDQVDALFDKVGLSSADSRKGDIYAGFAFMNNASQNFSVKKVEEGYYTITNELTNNVLTVDNGSKDELANVVPTKYRESDHQKFSILRDTLKYRYGCFIIAKHSGMALAFNDKGSVVQKKFNPADKGQVWCFSQRMVWKNSEGYLGVRKISPFKEDAVLANDIKTANWSYIAHPDLPNAYYLMNSKTYKFLMTEESYDANNKPQSYKLVQAPYAKGTAQLMLFYMNYADDTKTKVTLFEAVSKYVIDVDPVSMNLILVPAEKISPLSAWDTMKAPAGL